MIDDKLAEVAVASFLTIVSILGSSFFVIYSLMQTAETGPQRRSYLPFLQAVAVFFIIFSVLGMFSWAALAGCSWCLPVVRYALPGGMILLVIIVLYLTVKECSR